MVLVLLGGMGCRRKPAQPIDEEGRAIVENKSEALADAEALHRKMIEEMRSFDQTIEHWMADTETRPENQPVPLDALRPYLKGRLSEALKDGRLLDPLGNPYVILPLSPDSNICVTISAETEFRDLNWGDYSSH
jgi:hypothetical protein